MNEGLANRLRMLAILSCRGVERASDGCWFVGVEAGLRNVGHLRMA